MQNINLERVFLTMKRQLRVTLVRHGETTLNVQGVIQGHTDAHLNEVGIVQAETLGKHISHEKFSRAYASDLIRARHTAELILKHSKHPLEVTTDPRLRERNYGAAEGQPFTYYLEEVKRVGKKLEEYTPPGGETHGQVSRRIEQFFAEICEIADKQDQNDDPEHILIVTHGGLLKVFMTYLNSSMDITLHNFEKSHAMRMSPNTGVTRFEVHPLPLTDNNEDSSNSNGDEKNNEDLKQRLIKFHTIYDATHLKESETGNNV